MTEFDDDLPSYDADARRLALEAIATLVNIKRIAADQILRPVDVPDNLIRRFLTDRDATTNEPLTKRQGGALILDELTKNNADRPAIRKLVTLAAKWEAFHLASDEYKARAVVQKARELAGVLADADSREQAEQERVARQIADRQRQEREATIRQASFLLLAQFEHLTTSEKPSERGYLLEDLLGRLFDLHSVAVQRSFRRNSGGEQIDAAFEMDGWHYIVECRWRTKLADIQELDGLAGKVARSGRQTMGLFLSVNGWSENVVPLLKQNADKSIILMEGVDLRTVMAAPLDLRKFLKAKLSALNLEAEPFFPVSRFRV
ncbi:MAG: hypothetical protein AB7V53_12505 [Dongiaceae bacterium]